MALRRLTLAVLTLIVVAVSIGPALLGSLGEPQIANRLELYQADLLLRASQIQPNGDDQLAQVRKALLENSPVESAIAQYEAVRDDAQDNLAQLQNRLEALANQPVPVTTDTGSAGSPATPNPENSADLQAQIVSQQAFLNQVHLRLGILYARQDQIAAAQGQWAELVPSASSESSASNLAAIEETDGETLGDRPAATAQILTGLWSDPPRILPNAEPQIQRQLQGWFRNRALERLYQLQQRSEAIATLQEAETALAQQTLVKLALLGVGPALGSVLGIGLIVFLVAQRLLQGKQALLAGDGSLAWTVPWPWEITWQVLIVGFFFVGQLVLPVVVSVVRLLLANGAGLGGLAQSAASGRTTAITTLVVYLLMAAASLTVLFVSIRPYRPLPEGWFRLATRNNWLLWGLGGYLVAVPLVIGVSILNQQIWQGQGGSNPLLRIVLEEGDPLALGIFFFTAAIAAPVFEEFLFRGFLLPSLTRYLPVWGAIVLSSLIFALAHLSLSEVLPLTVLGMVLGFVYTRSRSLLSSMVLHSLWNSATMVGLLILGSGVR
ncbi:MAG: type II CAAX endopeptidase family protein [Synechococcales bacterium]|nr:type II CAAX endopeptidase family protein [Synechococcales bacterium]